MDLDCVPHRTQCSLLLARIGRAAFVSLVFAGLPLGHSAEAQTEKVAVGITNAATDAGFFIAQKKGYFRAEGIEITTTPFASAAGMIAPLGRGQLDVGAGTVAAGLYNAVEQGILLRIVADKGSVTDKLEYSTLVVRKDLVDGGRYKSLRDLKGMRSEEHTSELQSHSDLVCRLLLE